MSVLPVLMYHHVNPRGGDMVTITPEVFEAHLRHIVDAGYGTLSLDDAVAFVRGEYSPKGRCVALTFDDGWLDTFVYAWPLIRKYGVKATVFLVTGWADRATAASGRDASVRAMLENPPTHSESKRLAEGGDCAPVVLDWDMAAEMEASGLVSFYSHTVTHAECHRLGPDELARELTESKKALEKRLSKACPYLCWPRGKYNEAAVEAAARAGYRAVFTTDHGVARAGDDPMRVKRIVVKDGKRWINNKLRIYTSPLLSSLYLRVKGKK